MQENALNDAVQKIKGQLNIVNVIGSFISLKKKGNKYWGCCPFHNEKTPSFTVDENKGFYYCFGCHIGGSVIQFIMDAEHMTFHEAVEHLANRAGLAMPQEVNDAAMMQERAKRERKMQKMEEKALLMR